MAQSLSAPPLHPQEAARLALLHELSLLDTAPEPEFDAITQLLQQALGLPITLLSLVDQDRQWFKSRVGLYAEQTPRSVSFCAHAVAAERPLLVADARRDEHFSGNPLVTGEPNIVFYAGVPVSVEGLPIGTVCAIDTRPRDDGAHVLALLDTAAALLNRLLTARLQAERSRRDEALALEIAQLNSDWAWQTDAHGRVRWLDDRQASATGVDPGRLLGQLLVSAGGPPLPGDGAAAVDAAIQRGAPFRQLPLNWPTSTGSATLLFSGVALHDPAGRPAGYRGTASDPRRGLRAVERAERAEKLLAAAAERFAGAVMVADAQGGIVLANTCWRALYAEHMGAGRPWPEVLQRAVAAGEFPQALGCEDIFIASRLDPASPASTPMELLRNGRWWLTQEHRLPDGARLQIALDVTATKAAEARWRYHAELHQAVSRVVSDGIVVVNQYGDVISFNPAAAQLWRRSHDAMASLNIFSVRVDRVDDRGRPLPVEAHPVRQALRQQRPIEGFRYGLERPRAPIQWFDLDVIPLGNASEVVMVFRDVSDQRAASAARQADTHRSDRLTPLLADQVNQGAWQWDPRRRQLHLSAASWQMLGYRSEAPAAATDDILTALTHDDERKVVQETLHRQLQGSGDVVDLDCRLLHRDGAYRWLAMRGRINRSEDGVALEVSGLMSDITHQHAVFTALAQQQSAESASAAKSAFLSRVSHEIRTPLNAIVGFSRLLQRGPLPTALNEPVACIHEAGRHLLSLVNDLLDVQRIETDSLPLSLEAVDALSVMDSVRELLEVDAAGRETALSVDTASLSGLHVRADLQRLRQVLMNLVGNALKYGGDGSAVTLQGSLHGARLRLQVTDRGPGLSAEQQARLFQPFERLGHERSGIPGTGLGLVISKRLAEAMGGSLGLHSAAGTGSTFWIELPLLDAPALTSRAARVDPASTFTDLDASVDEPLTLLYVEDNPVNVILVETLVATLPQWRMRVATCGAEARALLAGWTPDLLLLDAHLPDANGLTLLPELRALYPALAQVPAVMFTADAMPQDHVDSRAAGFKRHWTKPIDVDAMLRELRELSRSFVRTHV